MAGSAGDRPVGLFSEVDGAFALQHEGVGADSSSVAERTGRISVDLSTLVDDLPDCVVVIDLDGVLQHANATVDALLGLDCSEWIGRSVFSFVHPDDLAGLISSIGTMRTKQVGSPIELRMHDGEGAWHWLEVIGRRVVLPRWSAGSRRRRT